MAFDVGLMERIHETLADEPGLSHRRLFGGYGFWVDGNMCAAVHGDHLMARIPADESDHYLALPGVEPFPKPMKSWVLVAQDLIAEDEELRIWLERGLVLARALPPK